ncbi:MAG: transketolase, partial [Solirubrobacterales bacterium]|nr:transketolase [Solirubrobacterales bacterium]
MTPETDQLCVDTIRTLSMDAIQKANSGHPGLPMAMAPAAYLLFRRIMSHDPADPAWPDRDRFVLSAGHGSMLLYSVLHLTGYDLPLDELKNFRQWGSITPGHPECDRVHVTPGVEITTGPLGQGFANGVGMAMAEQYLRERYGAEVMDHRTYAIVSDGDLMEGIASEAASLAGQLGLGRLIYLYDDNDISLDGPTSLSFNRENVDKRFEAYGWQVLAVNDANDLVALESAIRAGEKNESQPTLIRVKSIIGYPAPNKQGTSAAHGAALGDEEVALTKQALGWDPEKFFHIPDEVAESFSMKEDGGKAHAEWKERFEAWRAEDAGRAAEWDAAWGTPGRALPGMADALPTFEGVEKMATRGAGGKIMAAFEPFTPTMLGGAADLTESTKTLFPDSDRFTSEKAGRNIFFGVREHAMGAAVNGLAGHGGIVCPYGSTFMQFADYMRGSIRLSALMGLHVTWIFTHDSVGLGEDGPTHQPVEHYAALRAIPGLVVLRPCDAHETAEAWRVILEDLEGPSAMGLSRQDLPVLDRSESGEFAS